MTKKDTENFNNADKCYIRDKKYKETYPSKRSLPYNRKI